MKITFTLEDAKKERISITLNKDLLDDDDGKSLHNLFNELEAVINLMLTRNNEEEEASEVTEE